MSNYAETWKVTDVWYDKEWEVWMITAYDYDGNQVGDSEYEYRKLDAEDTARAYLDSDRCERIRIKGRDGMIQRAYGKEKRA
jgi:hypothetical protein